MNHIHSLIHPDAQAVLDFWYHESHQPFWFTHSDQFDQTIRQHFAHTLHQAAQGELFGWRNTIHGRLAEIIVLDQFSRNLYRDTPQAFSQDGMALALAQTAVALPEFTQLNSNEQHFLLLPYMHSESALIHTQALALFKQLNNPQILDFEIKHKVIIDRFGRYPHRNVVLGRPSTPEELVFLNEPHSSF